MKTIREVFRLGLVMLMTVGLTWPESRADVRVWNGGGSDALASNPLNWDGGATVPVSGDDILLDATSSSNLIWNLGQIIIGNWIQTADYTGRVTICTVYKKLK